MAKTKNIIFDLGGVLINLDFNKTFVAFHQLGFPDFEKMYTQYTANDFFKNFEKGLISNEAFFEGLISHHPKTNEAEITEAWNAMLGEFRLPSLAFLKPLAEHHQLFLLSNTNAIHLQAFTKIFEAQTGMELFDDFFTKAYYSHLIGLRKPDKEIFEFVLADAGLNAEETLFIDDSYNNIDTAEAFGFKTHLLVKGEMIETIDYAL